MKKETYAEFRTCELKVLRKAYKTIANTIESKCKEQKENECGNSAYVNAVDELIKVCDELRRRVELDV